MPASKYRFAAARLSTGWREQVTVTVDEAGFVADIEAGADTGTPIRGLAIPAMPNVHSHAHQRLMAGLAEKAGPGADSFWTWRETMYGFALKLGPEDLEAVAAQLYVEMLKAGFSVVGEFQYLHHQPDGSPYANRAELSLRCLAAAERAGIAITLLPALYAFGGFGALPPVEGQRRFINNADGFLAIIDGLRRVVQDQPLRRLGVAPHSLRAVSKPLLDTVIGGILPDAPIHIHVAEQTKEVDDCLAWSNHRPVDLLLANHDVGPRWTAIHATHISPTEVEQLARSGAVAGLCPTTEANLGDGIFAAPQFIVAGGAIAIGSDSHISVSVAEDLRMLEYSQRLRDRARNVLAGGPGRSTGATLFDAALAGGARAMAQPVGAIAPGYRADIAVLDADHPALIGRQGDDALDAWIFSGGNGCVKDVFVAGEWLVEDRRHVREEEIGRAFRACVERLAWEMP